MHSPKTAIQNSYFLPKCETSHLLIFSCDLQLLIGRTLLIFLSDYWVSVTLEWEEYVWFQSDAFWPIVVAPTDHWGFGFGFEVFYFVQKGYNVLSPGSLYLYASDYLSCRSEIKTLYTLCKFDFLVLVVVS